MHIYIKIDILSTQLKKKWFEKNVFNFNRNYVSSKIQDEINLSLISCS